MPVVSVNLIGRFGNQAMQYLFARAYAEQHGYEFQCDPWIGSGVFELSDKAATARDLPGRTEFNVNGEGDICFKDFYAQSQKAMIYTKAWAQKALPLGDVALALAPYHKPAELPAACHLRRGDYLKLGYPVVSSESYFAALRKYKMAPGLIFCSEESPRGGLDHAHQHIGFLPDFLWLMQAKALLRSNSTFSWLAGLLGNGTVYSPVIDGLGAGEHDVEFVLGNHKRFCNLDFVTDLHLPE